VVDNGYGHTIEDGFRRAAGPMAIDAQYFVFKTPEEAEQIARRIATDTSKPPVVFMTLDADAQRIVTILRRAGPTGPLLGDDTLGDEFFSHRFDNEPEERRRPGFFSDGLLGLSPMILDSANADTLAFAERFRVRFGHDPVWGSAVGYDAAQLAVAVIAEAMSELKRLYPGIWTHFIFYRVATWSDTGFSTEDLAAFEYDLQQAGIMPLPLEAIIPRYRFALRDYILDPTDYHPNARAHRLIAEFILREIRRDQ